MEGFTLERLWLLSDRFRFFVQFHRYRLAKIFSFWTITEHVSYASKELLIKQTTSSTWSVLLWKDYAWFLIELSILDFSSNLACPTYKNFHFRTITEHVSYASKKAPNQVKDLINMVSVTLDGLWMISDRIVNIRIFANVHRSWPAIIFRSLTIR